MSLPLRFSDLPADVVFSIFARCDIHTVVSVGQTCRYLHGLAFDKSVWLGLVDNLRRRSILDQNCTPSTGSLSTNQLIQIVKRLVNGPKTWNPHSLGSMAEVKTKITLHPFLQTGLHRAYGGNATKLLPSGRYVLFNTYFTMGCWHVAEDRLVWKHTSAIDSARVLEFAAGREEGDSLVIMICLRTYTAAYDDRKNYVEIVDVDLRSGNHSILLAARAPESSYDNPFTAPVIGEALAAVAIHRRIYMLINWRTQSCLLIECHPCFNALVILADHLVFVTPPVEAGYPEENEIHVISCDTLRAYWAPIIGVDCIGDFFSVSAQHIPKLSTIVSPIKLSKLPEFNCVSVLKSPLRDGEYRLWIHDPTRLAGFQLSLAGKGTPHWRSLGVVTHLGSARECAILPYSGHTISCGPTTVKIFPRRFLSGYAGVELRDRNIVHIAPYSGAFTYSTINSIVIEYFE
ncbi:hypothetical protein C8R47DRAFT_1141169 [Mycena vitilis]|nr:hypothetical protein C8R47DRAFT_1141169 [Mycena vitilis]